MQNGADEPLIGPSKITVLIVEDQLITRFGLRIVIERFPDLEVVAEAENGQVAVEQAKKFKPAVVLMDVGMPVLDGIEATIQIKALVPGTSVVILTSHDHDDDVFAALGAGADGYCLKNISAENLAAVIRTISHGACWLDPAIAKRVLKASAGKQSRTPETSAKMHNKSELSGREYEVLELVVEGLSNLQVAERLFISIETVKTHLRHIMEKLAVSDRTQAAVKALRDGLLSNRGISG